MSALTVDDVRWMASICDCLLSMKKMLVIGARTTLNIPAPSSNGVGGWWGVGVCANLASFLTSWLKLIFQSGNHPGDFFSSFLRTCVKQQDSAVKETSTCFPLLSRLLPLRLLHGLFSTSLFLLIGVISGTCQLTSSLLNCSRMNKHWSL